MAIKCIIIEDEPLAQNVLKKYLAEFPDVTLTGIYDNAIAAQPHVVKEKPAILFLDINLPTISGISFLKTLHNPPLIIFTTAYPDFAIEGFELDAVDYLLKPFSLERFVKAMNKARERLSRQTADTEEHPIFVKVDKKLYRVSTDEILYIEALDDYVKIVSDGRDLLTNNTLKNIQEELPPSRFIRVHKSYIVCIDRIEYIEGNYIRVAGKEIPIGAVYKDELLSLHKGKKK